MKKRCKGCGKDFVWKKKRGANRYADYCSRPCYSKTWVNSENGKKVREAYVTSIKGKLANAKGQAKKREIEWDLDFQEYKSLVVGDACYYCNGPLPKRGSGLDRLDSDGSYSLGNVVPCCTSCNSIKGTSLSAQQMLHVAKLFNAPKKTSSFRVYLGGKITTEDLYFREWRESTAAKLTQAGIVALNPLMEQEVLNPKDRGLTSSYPSESIMMRDYRMVLSSDLMIANLKVKGYNGKKIHDPIIGTFFEIAWAWNEKKPIIAIMENDNYVFVHHPMLQHMVTRSFSTVDKAVEEIINFWSWS